MNWWEVDPFWPQIASSITTIEETVNSNGVWWEQNLSRNTKFDVNFSQGEQYSSVPLKSILSRLAGWNRQVLCEWRKFDMFTLRSDCWPHSNNPGHEPCTTLHAIGCGRLAKRDVQGAGAERSEDAIRFQRAKRAVMMKISVTKTKIVRIQRQNNKTSEGGSTTDNSSWWISRI